MFSLNSSCLLSAALPDEFPVFECEYNVSQKAILFTWTQPRVHKAIITKFRLLVEMASKERPETSTELEPFARNHLYSVPVLCRTYTARIQANTSIGVRSHKNISIFSNPLSVFWMWLVPPPFILHFAKRFWVIKWQTNIKKFNMN